MLKKDIKTINEVIELEYECGHCTFDFDDYHHDLREMAEIIGVEMIQNEDEEWMFKNKKDEERVKDALNYYYDNK